MTRTAPLTSAPFSDFQSRVLGCVQGAPNQQASVRYVAEHAFPEVWQHPRSRGALSVRVAAAGQVLLARGALSCVLPAKRRTASPVLCAGFFVNPSPV